MTYEEDGDAAVRRYNREIDGVPEDTPLEVSTDEVRRVRARSSERSSTRLDVAAGAFGASTRLSSNTHLRGFDGDGVGQVVRPIERVGLYVPGTAVVYPSTVLMTAVPARVAGVSELVMATPASRGRERLAAEARCRRYRRGGPRLSRGRRAGHRGDGLRDGNGSAGPQDLRPREHLRHAGQEAPLR